MTSAEPRPIIGEPAPEIVLRDASGDVWRSSDHRGRFIVAIFHRHIH